MNASYDAVDLFAGPGGWDEGASMLGLRTIGLEWDDAACRTAKAAGHDRIRTDVASYPTAPFAGIKGLIASPPCQAWSMAGKRLGELDRANCHRLADRIANGDGSTDWTGWEDARSPLICQPVRRVRDLMPEWIALEEVPQVATLWQHYAHIFRGWGYNVWTGDLLAADYGVPQTRLRRILIGDRLGKVGPPDPTHSRFGDDGDLFGGRRSRWVSMAQALGLGFFEMDSKAAGGTMAPTATVSSDRPAPTLTSKGVSVQIVLRAGNQENACVRALSDAAPTIAFGHASNDVRWVHERPATTVTTRSDIGRPGHKDWAGGESHFENDSVRITIPQASVLQSFRPNYPWRGTRTKQGEQVGNAVPPRLACAVLGSLLGLDWQAAVADYYGRERAA